MTVLFLAIAILCAIQALRSPQLAFSAIWLGGLSVITAIVIYRLGAWQVAVMELSIGSGLVMILLVLAISYLGDSTGAILPQTTRRVKRWMAGLLGISGLVGGYFLHTPLAAFEINTHTTTLNFFGQNRWFDMLGLLALLGAGSLSLISLLRASQHLHPQPSPQATTTTTTTTTTPPTLSMPTVIRLEPHLTSDLLLIIPEELVATEEILL